MSQWIIKDWNGNRIDRKEWPRFFASFDDAEEALSIMFDDNGWNYDEEIQEYYIELKNE